MEKEEQVMSEVHLGCPPDSSAPHISYFTISVPFGLDYRSKFDYLFNCEGIHRQQMVCVDEDGDLVLTRRKDTSSQTFTVAIQHNITSSIPDVGLQLWKAELLLSDFVLHKMLTSSEFDDTIAIELGAGTGLVGMFLAHVAKSVFLTDHGNEILANCLSNVQLNSKALNFQGSIYIRELDWTTSWPPTVVIENSACAERCTWTLSEVEEAQTASLLLAADVIYSDDLTDALFCLLEKIMSLGQTKVLYLALEKRYNFTLDDLDVVANGYAHFQSYLRQEPDINDGESNNLNYGSSRCFIGKRIDLSQIPQYVKEYDRGNDVELWQILYEGRH